MAKKEFTSSEITFYLEQLALELERRGLQTVIEMMVFGGAVMVLTNNRQSTKDIDVNLLDGSLMIFYAHALPHNTRMLKTSIAAVGKSYGLSKDWVNDDGASFIREYGDVPEGTLWQTFGSKQMLHVYLPSLEYLLALKLLAGRPGKDVDDIKVLSTRLNIHTRTQAQKVLDLYINQASQKLMGVEETLKRFY